MPPKRPYDQTQEFTTSTQAKRLKLKDARTIAFQPVAGPSHTSGKSAIVNSMKGLPTQLDVEKFVQSRSFEIQSMEQAMKAAKSSTTHRAWQELPRHLRRRAASHDVRRVPQRLRDKSRKEIDAMKRKALGRARPKRGKKNEIPRVVTLLKRQKNKKWLETHLWHAKRMKMANMWGYRLAVQPTEKSFRPSHRASVHGSILHDASYESFLELVGEEPVLEHILLACCDPQGSHPSSLRFKSGVRMCETAIYRLGDYPIGLIGPVSLVWRPFTASKPSPESPAQTQQQNLSKRKRKKITGKKPTAEALSGCPRRTLWIRCHPLIHDEVLKTLKLAASRALEALKVVPEHTKKEYTVEVADLSSSVNIFELTGPKSSQIIHGALSPVFEDASVEFREFWSQLAKVQSAGSVPSGMVVSFTINDLRLSFPPKNTKVRINEDALPSMPQVWTCTPSEILANGQGDIWNTGLRMKVPSYTKRGLDLRRAQNTVPGTRLTPKPSDDKIPVMLIQRSVGPPSHSSSSTPEANLHGWTLIIPKFWSMAFLSSLVYTGTRVGGQRERAHQSFEACAPHFPRDFPLCAAYDQFAKERADEEKGRWERKPPAKRASWEVLGTRSPWMPDWAVVLGGKPSAKASSAVEGENDDEHDLVEAQRLPTSETEEAVNPWLLRGPDVRKVLDDTAGMLNPAPALWSYIDKLRRKRGMDSLPVGGDAIERLMRGALLRVKLMLVERGKPEDVAVIYDVPDREIGEWKKTVVEKRRLEKFGSVQDSADGDVEVEGEEQQDDRLGSRPKRDDIVGYVTSGNYSLLRGQAYGIGAMPVAVFLQLKERAIRFRLDNPLVKVRNRDGLIARYAYVDVLEG